MLIEGKELKEVDYDDFSRRKYSIYLTNDDTYESLYMYVIGEKHLHIKVHIIEKIKNENNNITKYVSSGKDNHYEITNSELDIELIEEIFNDMESNE